MAQPFSGARLVKTLNDLLMRVITQELAALPASHASVINRLPEYVGDAGTFTTQYRSGDTRAARHAIDLASDITAFLRRQ